MSDEFSKALGILTPLQQKFVEEMLYDPSNQTKAAIRAGYSEKDARSVSSQLMSNPRIKAALDAGQKVTADRIGLTQERIIRELMKIAFANIGDIVSIQDVKDLTRDQFAALEAEINFREIEGKQSRSKDIKLKPLKKFEALVQLGKQLGMFKDKVEVSGSLSLEQLVEASLGETRKQEEENTNDAIDAQETSKE